MKIYLISSLFVSKFLHNTGMEAEWVHLRQALDEGRYAQVWDALLVQRPGEPEALALLGISGLRLTLHAEADEPLRRAYEAGHLEAGVEYGNNLRALGRLDEATRVFKNIEPRVSGELLWRLERWWGVSEFFLGNATSGLARVESSYRHYSEAGERAVAARLLRTLGVLHEHLGLLERAATLYREALGDLPAAPFPMLRFGALQNLLNVQLQLGDLDAAASTAREACSLALQVDSVADRAYLHTSLSSLAQIQGLRDQHRWHLEQARRLSGGHGDAQLHLWLTIATATEHLLAGDVGAADGEIERAAEAQGWAPQLLLLRGLVARERGDLAAATGYQRVAADVFTARRLGGERAEALLHLMDTLHASGELEAARATLRELLSGTGPTRLQIASRLHDHTLRGAARLLREVAADPEFAPLLNPILRDVNARRAALETAALATRPGPCASA